MGKIIKTGRGKHHTEETLNKPLLSVTNRENGEVKEVRVKDQKNEQLKVTIDDFPRGYVEDNNKGTGKHHRD